MCFVLHVPYSPIPARLISSLGVGVHRLPVPQVSRVMGEVLLVRITFDTVFHCTLKLFQQCRARQALQRALQALSFYVASADCLILVVSLSLTAEPSLPSWLASLYKTC